MFDTTREGRVMYEVQKFIVRGLKGLLRRLRGCYIHGQGSEEIEVNPA